MPGDYDGVLALNAASGQVLWSTDLPQGVLDATQLLGVAGNHLIASGRRSVVVRCERRSCEWQCARESLPVRTGSDPVGLWPRLAGGLADRPVRDPEDRILVFDAASGAIAQLIESSAIEISAGNLFAGWLGYLLVAGPQELAALRVADDGY